MSLLHRTPRAEPHVAPRCDAWARQTQWHRPHLRGLEARIGGELGNLGVVHGLSLDAVDDLSPAHARRAPVTRSPLAPTGARAKDGARGRASRQEPDLRHDELHAHGRDFGKDGNLCQDPVRRVEVAKAPEPLQRDRAVRRRHAGAAMSARAHRVVGLAPPVARPHTATFPLLHEAMQTAPAPRHTAPATPRAHPHTASCRSGETMMTSLRVRVRGPRIRGPNTGDSVVSGAAP